MHQNPSQRLNLKISTGKGLNVLHISQTQTWRRKGFRIFDESIATVGEIRVYWRADFQSGSRVLKKVF